MPVRRTSNLFGGSRKNPFAQTKQPDAPAPRRFDLEQALCSAIKARKLVTLTYDDYVARTFQPTAVYVTSKDKVCVSGVQIINPVKPLDNVEPHNFEVGKITSVVITDQPFLVPSNFDRFEKKYDKGVICSV